MQPWLVQASCTMTTRCMDCTTHALYGTRGNSCNKYARFFLSPLSPSAVLLRPCGVRLNRSGVLLGPHRARLNRSGVLLRPHGARSNLSGVLLRPHGVRSEPSGVLLRLRGERL